MNSIILNHKPIIQKDGESIIDLTSRSLSYTEDTPVVIDQSFVADDVVMRPDTLSYIFYGSTDFFDLICKFNGISNPFALDRDQYVLAPDLRYMQDCLVDPSQTNITSDIRAQYIDPSNQSTVDPKRLEFQEAIKNLQKSASGINFSDFPLPPNLAKPGETERKISADGNISLGNNI